MGRRSESDPAGLFESSLEIPRIVDDLISSSPPVDECENLRCLDIVATFAQTVNAPGQGYCVCALASHADINSARSLFPCSYFPFSSFIACGLAATRGLPNDPSSDARSLSNLAIFCSTSATVSFANFCDTLGLALSTGLALAFSCDRVACAAAAEFSLRSTS